MLQSIAKGVAAEKAADRKAEARPATQAFVTEPLKPQLIAVGDAAHKNARRVHDATLVGLAPPPPVHFSSAHTQPLAFLSSAHTQPLALPQEQTFATSRDDRTLAAILVLGTLIAMFSIAFSAVPEREPQMPHSKIAQNSKEASASPAQPLPAPLVPAKAAQAIASAASESAQTTTTQPRVAPKALRPARVSRVKASAKAEPRPAWRRRIKAD